MLHRVSLENPCMRTVQRTCLGSAQGGRKVKFKDFWCFFWGTFLGVEPKIGVNPCKFTKNGWFISWKTLLRWMIWGYHYFWKHPFMADLHPWCSEMVNFSPEKKHKHPLWNWRRSGRWRSVLIKIMWFDGFVFFSALENWHVIDTSCYTFEV